MNLAVHCILGICTIYSDRYTTSSGIERLKLEDPAEFAPHASRAERSKLIIVSTQSHLNTLSSGVVSGRRTHVYKAYHCGLNAVCWFLKVRSSLPFPLFGILRCVMQPVMQPVIILLSSCHSSLSLESRRGSKFSYKD